MCCYVLADSDEQTCIKNRFITVHEWYCYWKDCGTRVVSGQLLHITLCHSLYLLQEGVHECVVIPGPQTTVDFDLEE